MRRPILLAVAGLAVQACRSSQEPGSEPGAAASVCGVCERQSACGEEPPHADKDVVPPRLAKPGDLTRCPVSNVLFKVEPASPRVEYAGRHGVVCCEGCKQHFQSAPERFASTL